MSTSRIGLVSISDRASNGVYQGRDTPALEERLVCILTIPSELQTRLIPSKQVIVEQTLCESVDETECHPVLIISGAGPACHDVIPDATLVIADREISGFGK